MPSRPTVTVVVATHNRPALLPGCIESIVGDLGVDDELLILESGDSGAAAAVVAVAGLPGNVRVISGLAKEKTAKLNVVLRAPSGEVLLSTDDDCRATAGWVDAMAEAFNDPCVGAAFGPVGGLSHVPGRTPARPFPPGPGPQELWAYAHGASMALRRRAVEDAGGFDERLGPGGRSCESGEEGDLLLRLREHGWTCLVTAAPTIGHVEWRGEAEDSANVLEYERGAGTYLGAGLRRSPRTTAKLFLLRLLYQGALWREPKLRGWTFGPRTSLAFARGVVGGLRLRPTRWL